MDLAARNLSVIIFLSVVGTLLLLLLLGFLYLNRIACFKRCDGQTCFDVKRIIKQAQHDLFTDSSSDEEETTPIRGKQKDEEKGAKEEGKKEEGKKEEGKKEEAKEGVPAEVKEEKK